MQGDSLTRARCMAVLTAKASGLAIALLRLSVPGVARYGRSEGGNCAGNHQVLNLRTLLDLHTSS